MDLSPSIVVWEYTLRCNSKCIHCGSDAVNARDFELTTQESKSLVDQIKDIGFFRIILSGGEPTLRKDWFEIGKYITEKGLEFGIISNALHWNDELVQNLASLNPFSIGLSVDGEQEIHDYIRGISGSHRKVFDSFYKLKKLEQTVCAVTTVSKMNFSELEKIRDRLFTYDIDAWQIQVASPMGRMAKQKDFVLDNELYAKLAEFIVDTRKKLPNMNVVASDCIGYMGKSELELRGFSWPGCMAGIQGIGIESDGTIKGCLSLRTDMAAEGNVREKSLVEIWNNPGSFSYNRGFNVSQLKGQCVGCKHAESCRGGCQSQSISFFNEFHHSPYCLYQIERGK